MIRITRQSARAQSAALGLKIAGEVVKGKKLVGLTNFFAAVVASGPSRCRHGRAAPK